MHSQGTPTLSVNKSSHMRHSMPAHMLKMVTIAHMANMYDRITDLTDMYNTFCKLQDELYAARWVMSLLELLLVLAFLGHLTGCFFYFFSGPAWWSDGACAAPSCQQACICICSGPCLLSMQARPADARWSLLNGHGVSLQAPCRAVVSKPCFHQLPARLFSHTSTALKCCSPALSHHGSMLRSLPCSGANSHRRWGDVHLDPRQSRQLPHSLQCSSLHTSVRSAFSSAGTTLRTGHEYWAVV